MDISKSAIMTSLRLWRAAHNAASFTRLARSAPENPGVPRAMTERSTSSLQRNLARVHAENFLAALDVRARDNHAAVEAAGAKQRGIEHVGAVGRGDQDHAFVGFKAVHFDQQGVERLLAFVVPAAEAGAAMAARRRQFHR